MYKITCERFNLNAQTDSIDMACRLADSVIELIGDEIGGHADITVGQDHISIAYIGDEYNIDGDIYGNYYDAGESVTYRLQSFEY